MAVSMQCRSGFSTVVSMTSPEVNGPSHFASLDFIAPLSPDRAQRLATRLAANDPDLVVDVGCGWGELLLQVVGRTASGVGVGVDIDELALQRGRELATVKGLDGRVRFVTRLEDAAVVAADVAICCGASHVFGTTRQALVEMYALTEPGGRVLFADGFWDKAAAQGSEAPDIMDDLSELGDLVDQAIAVGFRPLWIETASVTSSTIPRVAISRLRELAGREPGTCRYRDGARSCRQPSQPLAPRLPIWLRLRLPHPRPTGTPKSLMALRAERTRRVRPG